MKRRCSAPTAGQPMRIDAAAARIERDPWSLSGRWVRRHRLLGLGGAVFVRARLFRGLPSMNPFDMFSPRRRAPAQLTAWGSGAWASQLPAWENGVKEVECLPDRDGTLSRLRRTAAEGRVVQGGRAVTVGEAFLRPRATAMGLGTALSLTSVSIAWRRLRLATRGRQPSRQHFRCRSASS